MDIRGSRPVANSPDEFQLIRPGCWYGWPDFTGGLPVTLPQFKANDEPQPTFLLAEHPMQPPKPIANFKPHSATMGFSFNYNPLFGPDGSLYVVDFGVFTPAGPTPKTGVIWKISRL